MFRIGRWWGSRSATQRFDLSTRWSMYLLLGLPLLFSTSAVSGTKDSDALAPAAAAVLLFLAIAQGLTCAFLVNAALERHLGRPARLGRLVAAAAALTVTGVVAGTALLAGKGNPDGVPAGLVLAISFTGMFAAAVSPVIPTNRLVLVVAGVVALSAAAGAALGTGDAQVSAAVFAFVWVGCMTCTYKFSAWMIGVVWELDRGREAAARLAVAEERLRFARDLHDVLGRNLSVIAVKSELAGRLAERGDDGAAAEMLEVRQVAHDSLREVREVVRGYRTADLDAELAGARSVLRSAGVECRVVGDGARLPETVQAALGWVVREATTNVIRHSDATTCTIGLDVRAVDGGDGGRAATAVLRMENDKARPPDEAGPGGTGLAGLSERLAGLGGRLTAERRRGDRFVVEASVPVVAP